MRIRNEVTPKVTHMNMHITKSTPFLIKKHHLDDSEVRQALQYPQNLIKTMPRSRSFNAETVVTHIVASTPFPVPTQKQIKGQLQSKQQKISDEYYPRVSDGYEPKIARCDVAVMAQDHSEQQKNRMKMENELRKRNKKLTQAQTKSRQAKLRVSSAKDKELELRVKKQLKEQQNKQRQMQSQLKKQLEMLRQSNSQQTQIQASLNKQLGKLRQRNMQLQRRVLEGELNIQQLNLQQTQLPITQPKQTRITLLRSKPAFTDQSHRTDSSFSSIQL